MAPRTYDAGAAPTTAHTCVHEATPERMASGTYPTKVLVESLNLPGGDRVVHEQLKFVAEHHTARTRAFATTASRLVGRLHCSHGVEKPEPLPVIKNRDERCKAARDHRRAPSGAHSCCLDGVCEGNSREARECTY
ncbi:unnamed protein product, partial [Pylaiella littoralis]